MMHFLARPDGVGVSINVGVAFWYMFHISWSSDRILSKFARIQQLGLIKSRLVLGDLDLILKVITLKSLLNLCQKYLNSHYFRRRSADLTQMCMILITRHGKTTIKFMRPWPNFQGHSRKNLLNLGKKNAHYLRTGSVDFTQICNNSRSGYDISR